MMRGTMVAMVVLTAVAGPLAGQGQDPRLARLDEATRAAVAAVVDTARAAGLPIEPLVQKALEGAQKRAAGERIEAAVRALAGRLRTARAVLGREASGPELAAAAAALHVGARPDDLARLRERRPHRSLLVPLSVLSDLVARGVPVDTAAAAVVALADRLADEEYLAFRREVERDIALGAPPTTAVLLTSDAAGITALGAAGARPRKP